MGGYEMRTPTWSSGPIAAASTRRHRRLGLRRSTGADALALRARSVHTFGMDRPITVVACDPSGRVLRAERLNPRRLFFAPGAALIVETFAPELPKVGATVEAFARVDGCRATGDGRP